MITGRSMKVLKFLAGAVIVFSVIGLWIGGLVYMSCEWLDHSVLDGLRGASKAEVVKVLGQPSFIDKYRGMDKRDYERWSYQEGLRASEYELIFDDSGALLRWTFCSFD